MSPTILRLLLAYERQTRRYCADEQRYWRAMLCPASARFYGARANWPDALTQARDTLYWIERA